MKTFIYGIGFDDTTLDGAVNWASERVGIPEPVSGTESVNDTSKIQKSYIVTPNPEIVWQARKNGALKAAVNGAGLVLADGIGIVYGARILGTPIKCGRIAGIDFAQALCGRIAGAGGSLFLLGAKPGTAEKAASELEKRYPGLKITGTADGYFRDDDPIIGRINKVSPDVLFVCLGSPKQELWMTNNLPRLDVKLCIGLGGALDVFAGEARRAPLFFQKAGIEWLYRLIKEPRRIKRMSVLPVFIMALLIKRLSGGKRNNNSI